MRQDASRVIDPERREDPFEDVRAEGGADEQPEWQSPGGARPGERCREMTGEHLACFGPAPGAPVEPHQQDRGQEKRRDVQPSKSMNQVGHARNVAAGVIGG